MNDLNEGPRLCRFNGVAIDDAGAAQAYECVVSVTDDGSWTFDWHWTTGTIASVAKQGDSGPVAELLRSLFLPPTDEPGQLSG